VGSFCDYLQEIEMACDKCTENGIGACAVKLGTQKYYTGFDLSDTISIIRHDHTLSIETDIEVRYKTEYPYGNYGKKAPDFASEYVQKEKTMRDLLSLKLPTGARILRSHQHYNPDHFDPEYVSMHIHVFERVEDLDEAKIVAKKIIEAINPDEIEAALKD